MFFGPVNSSAASLLLISSPSSGRQESRATRVVSPVTQAHPGRGAPARPGFPHQKAQPRRFVLRRNRLLEPRVGRAGSRGDRGTQQSAQLKSQTPPPPTPIPHPRCRAQCARARLPAHRIPSRLSVLCVDWLELQFSQPIGARLLASISWWVCFSASPREVLPLPRLRLRERVLWGASPLDAPAYWSAVCRRRRHDLGRTLNSWSCLALVFIGAAPSLLPTPAPSTSASLASP